MTDVEFVIAGRRQLPPTAFRAHAAPLESYEQKDQYGNHDINPWVQEQHKRQHRLPANTQMWLVDFDKCSRVQIWSDTLNVGIRKPALGICANDPYYPNPLPDTQLGWDVYLTFTDTYIRAGRQLLQHAFEKAATSDEQLALLLQRPAMVMTEWTKIVAEAKSNNERDIFDARVRIRKENGWEKPAWWCQSKTKASA
jgi:hypothetical protein